MNAEQQKLSIKEKVGYSLGDTASNLFFLTFLIFMPKFYTDVFGLTASAVALMFLITKIWDAVNDPIMGILADRTDTKMGKYRPYILWFAIPLGVAGVLTFTTPGLGENGKLIYAYITYTAVMMLYTIVNVPYSALMGVMTPNAAERTVISSYRFVAAFVGQFVAQYAVGMLVVKFGGGDNAKGYQLTLGLLSAIAVILLFITFATTKERVHPPKGQKSPIRQDMRDLFTNGPWLMIGIATFFQLFFISLRSGIIPYYFDYYVNSGEVSLLGITRDWSSETLLTTYLMTGTAIMVLGAVLTKKLTRIIGKAICYWSFLGLSAATTALYYFLDPDDLNLMFILNFVRSFAMGPVSVLQWAMYTDCADYSEWKTGRRATALIMSASLFSLKMGLAVGSAALTWILAIYGYEANVEQSEESIKGIVLLMSIYPAVIALFGMIAMVLYPLNNKKMAQIETELVERRKQTEKDPADA